jgi:hypothetical protein
MFLLRWAAAASLCCCAPLAAAAALPAAWRVAVDWAAPPTAVSRLRPTLQVVPNAAAFRSSPIHDAVWAALADLGADLVRLQLWLPFPGMAVAALEPPSPPGKVCGFRAGDSPVFSSVELDCGAGSSIVAVDFAVYGESSGACGALAAGACAAPGARAAVEAACLGMQSCTVDGSAAFMGGAAPCASPTTAVQVSCGGAGANRSRTSWDFSRMDEMVDDFLNATRGHPNVVDFSTPPQWLYSTAGAGGRVAYPDDPEATTWTYEQGGSLRDPSAAEIGDFYGRVLAWYTDGGFVDEAGEARESGHFYNITTWEYLNEMEHGLSPRDYTTQYDAVVLAQRRLAPRGAAEIKYMGLALEQNNDVGEYFSYFLNASNHAPGVPLPDYVSLHFYAGAPTRSNASGYEAIFDDIDGFMPSVARATALRDALSPRTLVDMDEAGVILPDDNSDEWTGDSPGFAPVYWSAVAASFMYRFATSAPLGLDFLGDSALAQIPNMRASRGDRWAPQFPSVSLLDWETGAPNARYQVLKLLIDQTSVGMGLMNTTVAPPAPANPFCGSAVNLGSGRAAVVELACAPGAGTISEVLFADYGLPAGDCPAWAPNPTCSAANNATALVRSACVGQASCRVSVTDGGPLGDPCLNNVKTLAIVAQCAAAPGGAQVGEGSPVFALGVTGAAGAARRVLLLNKSARPQAAAVQGSAGGTWAWVDEATGSGPAATMVVPAGGVIALAPFAAGMLTMPSV